ncbi:MAG: rod shape-determining protein [Pirellulales bacterium]|nr:rod shape-determining protein [Pirellulales bacterium]
MLAGLFDHFRNDLVVDLGTSQTRIGVVGEGLVLDEPSLAAVEKRSGRILSGGAAVGHLAKQMEGRMPEAFSVRRPLREGVIADFRLCQAMLRQYLRKARRPGWRLRPRVLAGVPGNATPVEKQALLSSLLRAGAGRVWILPQVMAAAVGAGLPLAEPAAGMVCNLGAGTTEAAVLSLGDRVAGESIRVGGDAFDQALVDYLRRHYSLRVGLPAAERLRIEIGSAFPLEEELTAEVSGLDAVSGLPRRATVTSEEVRQALAEPLEKIVEALRLTLDRCPPEMAADLVENGLVLCGGGALLRRLDRYLNEHTGLPARLATEPAAAVVHGLLVCLEHFDKWRPLMRSSEDDVY